MQSNKKENIGVIISFVLIVALIFVVIFFLLNKQEKENPLEWVDTNPVIGEQAQNQLAASANEPTQELIETEENNMERVSKEGDVLSMNYTGRLEDGTIFDSNVLPEFGHVEPFNFTLGAGQVIAGWDEGLAGMKIGEKKTLTIPPEKGYGANGNGSIPPNATLVFDVELLDIR
ncbi:MAG TPA: FKBP-type peptidyl-prolyl cis-trans isomerase [Candidatus Paceibacterota bacterium]|nr:FKBP-type peptidyl-prolyl cis-trans isomerase [Candidatus Paceibacterota bacterium]HQQ21827.1 FKBP-type peptidyl-prolyl cis-trans isomerase [Candidatus Paceibacterota bacterium]